MIRELWNYRKLTTKAYPVTGANVASAATPVPVEITQYAQEEVFDQIILHVHGNVVVAGGGGAGAATGAPNPHGLLNRLTLQTQPQYKGIVPFNNISARSLLTDAELAYGFAIDTLDAPIPDLAGTYAADFYLYLFFKRPKVRKGIQWAFYLQKYTSALLTLNFGGREQLFTGGTNTWDLTALQIDILSNADLAVQATDIHASEIFEQTYNINAAQTDFPIDTLPPGYLYTDITFQTEVNGALANTVLNNINIQGGGRVWLPQGDLNAAAIQRNATVAYLNDQNQPVVGIYALPLRDGMFTRAIDALTAPITIKLDVNAPGAARIVRLLCRRMIPQGVQAMVKTTPKTSLPNVAGH
jgi:hypothetical protein